MSTATPCRPLLLIALVLGSVGCGSGGEGGETPFTHPLLVEANVHGFALPDSAQVLTPEAFAALLDSGEATLISKSRREDELDRARLAAVEVRARAHILFANDASMEALIERRLPTNDPDFIQCPDGNVLFRGILGDVQTGRTERWFKLLGPRFALQELVDARETSETSETQHALYAQMFRLIPTQYIVDHQLPHPDDVQNDSLVTLRNRNGEITEDWREFIDNLDPTLPPAGYPASWLDEEGVDFQSDRDDPNDVLPSGLRGLSDFPLKWCATHVRDQGVRATGRAFAITGAVEARFAATNARWLNLSEQLLYNQANGYWFPSDREDGLCTERVLGEMVTRRFRFPYERDWDYNRSLLREEAPLRYVKSCWADALATPYGGEFCSDTTHQSEIVCTRLDSREFCAKRDPRWLVFRTSLIRVVDWRTIYFAGMRFHGPDGPEDPMDMARIMLALKIPVTLLFWMPRSFSTTPSDGVVPFDSTEAPTAATHSMLLVGYIANADLPVGGPPPAPSGGYFICKNSMGTAWGDAGYGYVTSDWVSEYAYSMHALLDVTDS